MTARELLRQAANWIDPTKVHRQYNAAELAAALRALADRIDAEERAVEKRMHVPSFLNGMILQSDAAKLIAACLARLDAPLSAIQQAAIAEMLVPCASCGRELNHSPDCPELLDPDAPLAPAPVPTVCAPKCECDKHDTPCTHSADYLITRDGKRLAVCDRCTLPGDGLDDRDLDPDWSQHRPLHPATPGER